MSDTNNAPASPETNPTPPAPAPTSTPEVTTPAAPAAPEVTPSPAPAPAPVTPPAPAVDNSAIEATVAELKTQTEQLKTQLTEAQNNPANSNSAEIGELNVKLNRMQILQESPEVAAKIKPILEKNPYAIWGTDDEMRDQIKTLGGAMGIDNANNSEVTPSVNGTNPPAPQAVQPPPVSQLTTDELWAKPLDELEASIRQSGETKYV